MVGTGPHPIAGVRTSTAGFIGATERGPLLPRLVTSWDDYVRWYGSYFEDLDGLEAKDSKDVFLPYAVRGFFDNGGKRLFVARVVGTGQTSSVDIAGAHFDAIGPGDWGNDIRVKIEEASLAQPDNPLTKDWFRITVAYYRALDGKTPRDPDGSDNEDEIEATVLEVFDNLSHASHDSNFAETIVNSRSRLVKLSGVAAPMAVTAMTPLAGGEWADPKDADYEGAADDPTKRTGLAALGMIEEIALLAAPAEGSGLAGVTDLTAKMIAQCELRKDRVAILSGPRAAPSLGELRPSADTNFGAFYFPWLRVVAPHTPEGDVLVPPCGHVAGIYARVDAGRGVHEAPANEGVHGITSSDLGPDRKPLQVILKQSEHELLNPRGVNVICDFRAEGRGILVWGARTMSSSPE